MAVGNSIGEQTTGITGFTGTAFTGTPVTQHLVQIGGATSSTLAEVAIGTSGQVLTSNGAGVAPTFQAVSASSYSFQIGQYVSFATPFDATTYYVQPYASVPWTTAPILPDCRIYIPKTSTIRAVVGSWANTISNGSGESVTIAIRLNDTSNTNVTTSLVVNAALNPFSNTAMSLAVTAGDFISFMIITPTWATNPGGVMVNAAIFLS